MIAMMRIPNTNSLLVHSLMFYVGTTGVDVHRLTCVVSDGID